MNTPHSFGQQVKARRRELGLTQDELARRVGCAAITVRKVEADALRPSVQIAERLALALTIPPEERAAFIRRARTEAPPTADNPADTTPAAPTAAEIGLPDLTGRTIRGYALGARLGQGGFGAVYRATQPQVEREVAVKIILPQYANHPEFIRRFEAEAQLVARLEHPHIVPLYDYWREPNAAYLIMRLLRGGNLQSLLHTGPLPPPVALRVIEQIGAALTVAHRAGVIHRDLKPANVLLDEDHNAYLADFGIAKDLNSHQPVATQADAIIGSPDYISPEQIRSELVGPQTDIYALGVLLYELLTGTVPFHGPTPIEVMHQHLTAPLPPLAASRAGLPLALDSVIEHATAKPPAARYQDVESFLRDLRAALSEHTPPVLASPATTPPAVPGVSGTPHIPRVLSAADSPYKGLRAFTESDAPDFFGREALIQQLLARLGEGGDLVRFLAVVGPSGSGKSSAVKAGLLPALRRGALPGSEQWFVVDILPGLHPLEALEAALLRIAVNPPATLLEQLQNDKRGLVRAVRRCLPDDPAVELVLVIDQFEELFTLTSDEALRAHFLDLLTTATLDEHSRLRILITLRADFVDRPLGYVDFGELLRQRLEVVLPLTPDELEQAIVKPAERVGLQIEPGLVETIQHDVLGQPGMLPLLQYALTELFERRDGTRLTKAAYQSIRGVLGALGRRAEEVFASLDPAGQAAAKQVFLRLVTQGAIIEDTRRRVLRTEIETLYLAGATARQAPDLAAARPFAVGRVMDAFGKSHLLAFDRDPATRGPTVEVAHEALLREWERLREWLSESRADLRLQQRLAVRAAEWHAAVRERSYLLQGAQLTQYEGWAQASAVALTQVEREFLNASLVERDQLVVAEITRQQKELKMSQELVETQRQRLHANKRIYQTLWAVSLITWTVGLTTFGHPTADSPFYAFMLGFIVTGCILGLLITGVMVGLRRWLGVPAPDGHEQEITEVGFVVVCLFCGLWSAGWLFALASPTPTAVLTGYAGLAAQLTLELYGGAFGVMALVWVLLRREQVAEFWGRVQAKLK